MTCFQWWCHICVTLRELVISESLNDAQKTLPCLCKVSWQSLPSLKRYGQNMFSHRPLAIRTAISNHSAAVQWSVVGWAPCPWICTHGLMPIEDRALLGSSILVSTSGASFSKKSVRVRPTSEKLGRSLSKNCPKWRYPKIVRTLTIGNNRKVSPNLRSLRGGGELHKKSSHDEYFFIGNYYYVASFFLKKSY